MCGEHSQWVGHTGVATAQGGVHFQVPATQAPRCSVRTQSQMGRVSCALPSSKPLRLSRVTSVDLMIFPGPSCSGFRVHEECTVSVGPWVSCPSQVQASQALGCVTHADSQVDHASGAPARSKLLDSWVCHEGRVPGGPGISLGELVSGCDTPGTYELSRIPVRHGRLQATCSQFDGRCGWDSSGPLPSTSGCSTPASLPQGGP